MGVVILTVSKKITKIACFVSMVLIASSAFSFPLQWQKLAPGLEYTRINTFASFFGKDIHVFRFDLHDYQMQLASTMQNNRLATIAELVHTNHAAIGVNGGFFSPELKPLGLRINQGEVKNKLKPTAWWGVFYTRGANAYVVAKNAFKPHKNIDFAVQSGPRLIIDGKIAPLKPGEANRTALGITRDGKVVLLVTSDFPLSTAELAEIMQQPAERGGLDCVNALNLDGGSSTQLYAWSNNFTLSVPSFAAVADAVLVVPR